MGRVLDGNWITTDLGPDAHGRYVRRAAKFRAELSDDGTTPVPAEPGRYHLYASHACGWCHRVLIVRALKGLEHAIGTTWTQPFMGENGWRLIEDPLGHDHAWQVYVDGDPTYTGRASVPILWDNQTGSVVTNESMDLLHCLDSACNGFAEHPARLWPDELDAPIRAMLAANYGPVNNGVYRAGFASSQQAHAEAATALFERLDELDALLADRPWLLGDRFTAADVGLFPTLFRFDAVYHTHFKCNLRRLVDYDNLWDWTRAVYQLPGVAGTCDLQHAKAHYYTSHESIHPRRYVPIGPQLDFDAPTQRPKTWF